MWTCAVGKDALCPCHCLWITPDHRDLSSWTIICTNNNYPKYWLLGRLNPLCMHQGYWLRPFLGLLMWLCNYLCPLLLEQGAIPLYPFYITTGTTEHTKPLLAMFMGTMAISSRFSPAPNRNPYSHSFCITPEYKIPSSHGLTLTFPLPSPCLPLDPSDGLLIITISSVHVSDH